ncbi:hypothetical protein CORC01_06637 [Colletotrichum orchidophilum]|uniref:Uncharacterized protein n=1 Tax=Colletotrichum orchidophilum TaxID=1209926 RepID=A0A1G4B9P6_9PEZI|nr:uncharacterized protein CORC01_06637 [Colletotrichum orchidophilum]OHE98123.1 hypothetical protein CORC01_06637 [Colletotrichum orchidophilum]
MLVLYLEDSRHAARPNFTRLSLWLLLFQATGIGVLSVDSKQVALVLWNVFPILVPAAFAGIQAVTSAARGKQHQATGSRGEDAATITRPSIQTSRHTMSTISLIYAPALIVSVYSHVAILAVTLFTRLFPALFRPEHLASLTPWGVFVPPLAVVAGQTCGRRGE